MTQKELLYYEDAVCHEKNIIDISKEIINNLEDDNIKNFMELEIEKHENLKESLINKLEEKSNE